MAKTTYFVVLPFVTGTKGIPFAADPVECRSADHAQRVAARMAPLCEAVIAFARAGDPDIGEYEEAEVLVTYGNPPEAADVMAVAV